eukprot:jgi/Botrbrau1/8191/Bobra.357_2s0034.1
MLVVVGASPVPTGSVISVRLVWWVMNTTLSFPVRPFSRSGTVTPIFFVPPFGRYVSSSGKMTFSLWLTSFMIVFSFGLRFVSCPLLALAHSWAVSWGFPAPSSVSWGFHALPLCSWLPTRYFGFVFGLDS